MTSLDEYFEQYLNRQLAQKLGADYGKICNNVDRLIKVNDNNVDEIKRLKLDISDIKELYQKIINLEAENKNFSQIIGNQEIKNSKLQIISETATRNELLNKSNNNIQNDRIITIFNEWAANPISIIPKDFAYLIGDFRIRINQQELAETQEKTKWIINRGGVKKYLLPNPNFFDPMTNISELYKMNLNMLKAKGKNKIKIITPCEISSSGFIELPGELEILC